MGSLKALFTCKAPIARLAYFNLECEHSETIGICAVCQNPSRCRHTKVSFAAPPSPLLAILGMIEARRNADELTPAAAAEH